MQFTEHRVVTLRVPCAATEQVADAVMLCAKNISNTTLFLVRNVLTAYEWDAAERVLVRRVVLHEHQHGVLQRLNEVVTELNAYWAAKGPSKPGAVVRQLPLLGERVSSSELNRVITNTTAMERLFKAYQGGTGFDDYHALPAVTAQRVLQDAVQQVKNYFAALVAHYRRGDAKAGRPQLPGYLGKNERRGFAVNEAHFTKEGRFPALAPERHVLRESFGGAPLGQEQLQAWNTFDIAALKSCALQGIKRRLPTDASSRITQLRCVPEAATGNGRRRGGVKWEAVVEVTYGLPQTSLLHQAIVQHDQGTKRPFAELSPSAQNDALKAFAASLSQIPAAAGLDLGVVNHATLATTAGQHIVYAGRRTNERWARLSAQLDALKARIYRQSLPKELLTKLEANRLVQDKAQRQKLTREERVQVAQANGLVYAEPKYRQLLQRLQEDKRNHLHQLASDIIRHCLEQEVQLLVIGRNKGWKNEVDCGRAFNRLFTTIAHWRLIELLKYKGAQRGLVVIDTEESYTSKASFVGGDALPTKGQETAPPIMSGSREGLVYKLKRAGQAIEAVHADLNGALNILRKILAGFVYRSGFSLKYVVKTFGHRWRALPTRHLGHLAMPPERPGNHSHLLNGLSTRYSA